jgi:hypothetical protein
MHTLRQLVCILQLEHLYRQNVLFYCKWQNDRLCDLVVRVPGCRAEMYVFPVRYELNLYMLCRRK